MRWPLPKNLRAESEPLHPLTQSVARLRIPLERHAFVALFELVARRGGDLAGLVARELAEAADDYRHVHYGLGASGRRDRRRALRRHLVILRRRDLSQGRAGAEHDWERVHLLGMRIEPAIAQWLASGRKLAERRATAEQIASLLAGRRGGLPHAVTAERISRQLADGRKAPQLTLRVLALAVYGAKGSPDHLLKGLRRLVDPPEGVSPFRWPVQTSD